MMSHLLHQPPPLVIKLVLLYYQTLWLITLWLFSGAPGVH